ncbi:MAG: peptidylprolyl isomerase [Acidobacteriota bacterium]
MIELVLAMSLVWCGAGQAQTAPAALAVQTAATAAEEVGVITTDVGRIVIRFFPDVAPNHVDNFKDLARTRFYDGTTFHRVVPGFVIQGGDPNSKDDDPRNDGLGDGPRQLKAEFNDRPHVRGSLSMARSRDPNSASCQFFIVLEESPQSRALDGKYTLFGEVIEGMDTVERIVELAGPVAARTQKPRKPVVMRSVRIDRRPPTEND